MALTAEAHRLICSAIQPEIHHFSYVIFADFLAPFELVSLNRPKAAAAESRPELVAFRADLLPACQWAFNRERHFHYICGDAQAIFRRPSFELMHQHVSMIDDHNRSWATRLGRIFSGHTPFDTSPLASGEQCTIIHLPIRATDSSVMFAAGFACLARQTVPAAPELELLALAILEALEQERAHTQRFLHDVVAQYLSSTGLQLELLRLDAAARGLELPALAGEIQQSLEETLDRVKAFGSQARSATA